MPNLKTVYLTALARCAPDLLVRAHVDLSMPRDVVAIGKCAGGLLDGVANVIDIESAFVAIPEGYKLPRTRAEVHIGGHPHITAASFEAGRALLKFVDEHRDILFLISGGGSACVEVPVPPHSEEDVARANAQLIASSLPIREINARRSELSAIKGGRLRERVKGRAITLIYSDVASGRGEDVASGPTGGGIVIADNITLVKTAAALIASDVIPSGVEGPGGRGHDDRATQPAGSLDSARDDKRVTVIDQQIECDVAEAARMLATTPGKIIIAGGEPTVVIQGSGKGGRCSELAVRFAMESTAEALFASSDGVDGNSGAAGIYLPPRATLGGGPEWQAAIHESDTMRIAAQIGEPIMIAATGNNLRDLFLVARD
jgi:glycerate-2-kinase